MTRRDDDDADADRPSADGRVRLDKWLWAARFYKTRGLASDAIDGGKVDVNGERAKRAKQVKAGDTVAIRQSPYLWTVTVTHVAERRGSATDAARLYQETDESRAARAALATQLKSMPRFMSYGDSRPTKKDRREIRRLKGDD
ncbi:MAG: S4 domain-containing protein [Gemmatimonadaceae bacterium]|jgi:ribosome-associated heat shock protein Hsp15|nr:S4 domain-containing protein [Gemmatimonadaceae bacterium]